MFLERRVAERVTENPEVNRVKCSEKNCIRVNAIPSYHLCLILWNFWGIDLPMVNDKVKIIAL